MESRSLRVQITQIDHTLAKPGALDNTTLPKAPVIRVYGASSTGKKCCLHIHQVYPYFFVEYPGKMTPDSVNQYIARLTHSLDHAIAVSLKRNPKSLKSQFVRAIILVKGVHFYGFHSAYTPFLKVYIADPAFVNRAVTILQSGSVMETRFHAFESHLSYILQFLCDFGLYGCGWLDLREVWQRGQEEGEPEELGVQHEFQTSPYYRQSRMPLEVDTVAALILNRDLLAARNLHHKLTIPTPPLPAEPLVLGVRELWEDERRRRIAAGLAPSPEIPQDPSEKSRGAGGGWVAEARWWDEIRKRIESERGKEAKLKELPWEKWIMTTFESVEALWENKYKIWKPGGDSKSASGVQERNPYEDAMGSQQSGDETDHGAPVEVDETMLSSQELSILVENEENEWAKLLGRDLVDGNDELAEDEMAEDGPPLDLDADDTHLRPETPNGHAEQEYTPQPSPFKTPRKRPNAFQAAFKKLAECVFSKHKRSSVLYNGTRTPATQVSIPPKQQNLQESLEAARQSLFVTMTCFDLLHTNTQQDIRRLFSEQTDQQHIVHDVEHDVGYSQVDEISTLTKIDNGESRPIKRLKLAHGPDARSSFPPSPLPVQSGSAPALSATRYAFGAQSPRVFSSLARKGLKNLYSYAPSPPSVSHVLSTIGDYGVPDKVYRDPHYSVEADAPERPWEFAGLVYHLKGGDGLSILEDWKDGKSGDGPSSEDRNVFQDQFDTIGVGGWEFASSPPSRREVCRWLNSDKGKAMGRRSKPHSRSQLDGPTQLHPFGLKDTPPVHAGVPVRERQGITLLSLEVFAPSRESLLPDPELDPLTAAFYTFQSASDADTPTYKTGIIVVRCAQLDQRGFRGFSFEVVDDELDLLNKVVDTVLDLDPDIVAGWEIQGSSWGYLSARGRHFGFDISEQMSRAPGRTLGGNDQWGLRTTSTFHVVGRHVLNVWRIMRVEQSLNMYTFENTVFHLLHRRVPKYTPLTLTEWFNSPVSSHGAKLLRYFIGRCTMVLEMLDASETITKTAEFARVFGVDFFSVISRGSQFKVESFMFRIAKPESFVLLSPSKKDVGAQNAAECMPLIMEPLSAFYSSPLVVLDFQSLYPSIMVAYNYCYSTCLGRVTPFKGQYKFGVTELNHRYGLLDTLHDHITVAPNGMMYVKAEVRKGLLGRMLTELLDTRVMVKQAMKSVKDNKALRKILDARQLGLKYIANVTYGYTSATYSGRMPAVEIADSIVQSGRETLEKAIKLIETHHKWGARVVYGDTDSLFIYLPGKTKEQAFRIGHDIADSVTKLNPAPVKLKFEKVYLPCLLMAKKRYVGFKYENPDDVEPVFDAKGIETVRRDGVPAQKKMTEKALKILFRSQDLSEVKEYCCRSWSKILENKISIQDFIFAREVKMGTYSDKAAPPPGVTVAARRMLQDQNDEPQYGERVPYIIARGAPNTRLVDRAVAPEELLNDRQNIDGLYYITRVLIPPLERIFNLVGADVKAWFDEMPRRIRADQVDAALLSPSKSPSESPGPNPNRPKIEEHFRNYQCITCGCFTAEGVCDECRMTPQETITGLLGRIQISEHRLRTAHDVCTSCTASEALEPIRCESLDCSWLYQRKKAEADAEETGYLEELIEEIEEGRSESETVTDSLSEETEYYSEDDGSWASPLRTEETAED
ncbi:hypothetical protein BV25DRAFT_1793280 [Artomyces pyxidatus]|uniref:Uncharacterized protein n=1 Tax=Artomyces pyxidatus TaxID=48021 RepID=A0ACB8TIF5_9AGAM|nr:hypothetical protein BV25DRAFT_1793280 [Artomyces pyxidatus]